MAAKDSFKVLVRKTGEDATAIDVTAATTIAEIRALMGLKGYACCYKGHRKGDGHLQDALAHELGLFNYLNYHSFEPHHNKCNQNY